MVVGNRTKLPESPSIEAGPAELERYFLSCLRTAEEVNKAKQAGVRDESFQVQKHANAWQYILKSVSEGKMPSRADICHVNGIELDDDVTDIEFYQEDIVARTIFRLVAAQALALVETLPVNPRLATEALIANLGDIVSRTATHNRDLVGGIRERQQRVLEYVERKARGETIGVPTGLHKLDSEGNAWRPGELIAVQGPLNVGKSFLLLYFCAHAFYHNNQKILFLTPEMTIDEVELRLDPIIANFMGMSLSNEQLRTGQINPDLWNEYIEKVELFGHAGNWHTVDSGDAGFFTIDEILTTAREVRPDILAIDGVHLIRGKGKSWEAMKEASEALKGLAQHNGMIILGGTQVIRDAVVASDDTADLGQAAYGMAFLEAADRVLSLAEKRGDTEQRIWKMPKNRTGKKIMTRQYMKFSVDIGVIGDVKIKADDATGEVDYEDGF